MAATQKALRLQSPQGEFKVDEVPMLVPGPGEILVKLHSVGLNPVDWKIQKQPVWKYLSNYPAVLGVDSAGTIAELGKGVEGFEVGDRT